MKLIPRRSALALLTAVLVGAPAITTASAAAASPAGAHFATSLAPSVPTDPMLHGVTAGSAPWVIKHSTFRLLAGGEIVAVIRGLVIPSLGTPGPVTSVDAALYCANETTPAATTASVPLSTEGNAVIVDHVSLPSTCLTPAVLINPNSIGSIYISTSGFSG